MKQSDFALLPIAVLSLALLIAAAPVPDPVRDSIIADARTISPASLAFDRTTKLVRSGGGSTTAIAMVERWDGKAWTLVSYNGKPPTTSEKHDAERLASTSPVPGYHRLAVILAGATETRIDAQGRTVLHIPILPPGSVLGDGGDISSHLMAEATLASQNGQNWVQRVRVTAREPFKMNMLIKVTSFEQISDYRLGTDGKPRLASQVADSAGTMFGFSGGQKTEVTYAYR